MRLPIVVAAVLLTVPLAVWAQHFSGGSSSGASGSGSSHSSFSGSSASRTSSSGSHSFTASSSRSHAVVGASAQPKGGFLTHLRRPFQKSVPISSCAAGKYWNGSGCFASSLFRPDDCSGLAYALRQQASQMQYAAGLRQSSCAQNSTTEECSQLTAEAQGEAARRQSLLRQYQACRAVSCPYGDHSYLAYVRELYFE